MKKIISLLLMIVLSFAFVGVTTFAADATSATIDVTFAADSIAPNTASTMTVKVTFDGTYVACAVGLPFVAEGFTVDSIESILLDETSTSGYAINDGSIVWSDFNQTAEISTITINCAITTGDAGTGKIIFDKYNGYLGDDASVGDIYLSENEGDVYSKEVEIKAAGNDKPELADNEVEVVGSHVINGATELDEGVTEFELGTGVYLEFVKKADFTDMIWAFTVGGAKKYSAAKAIDLTGINNGVEVILTAAFANGNIEAFDQAAVAPVAIEAVNAIFKAGEAEYFTDLTDKKPE